jgi:hypothetical protein
MTPGLAHMFAAALAAAQVSRDPGTPEIRLNTRSAFQGFSFFGEGDPATYGGRAEVLFAPDLELKLHENARVETGVELRMDGVDSSRNRLYLFEGFLELNFESWDVRAGRQIVRSGRVDGIRPTDYFRRQDFTDFLAADEEPVDAVRIDRFAGDWVFTGVWTPYFQANILPIDPRNRWTGVFLPPAPEDGPPVQYVESDSSRPSGLDSSEVGLWAGRRGSVAWSGSYFYGYERIPSSYAALRPSMVASGESLTVELFPHHQRLHVFGFDGETTLGDFAFRGEGSYTRSGESSIAGTSFDAPFGMLAAGGDRTFSGIAGSHDLYLNLQYLFDSASAQAGEPAGPEFANPIRHFYRHAMTALTEYRLDSFRKLVAKLFFNLAEHDYVLQSEFEWKPWDGWSWIVGVDFVGGPESSFFGAYAANDRVRTGLTYDWQAWNFIRSKPSEPVPLPILELQTTAWVGGEWQAVINGSRVRRGDTVEGATVLFIQDGVVELELSGRSFALRF